MVVDVGEGAFMRGGDDEDDEEAIGNAGVENKES